MTKEKRAAKLAELRAAEKVIKKLVKEMGLIPMTEATELRQTSRQALIQLAKNENSGLDKVKLLEDVMGDKAHTFFFKDQIISRPRREFDA